jgi:hypothetical protein
MCHLDQRKYSAPYAELPRAERLLVDAARAALREDDTAVTGISLSCDLNRPDATISYPGLPMITGYVFMSIFKPRLEHIAAIALEMRSGTGWPERSLFTAIAEHSPDADVLRIGSDGSVQRWTLAQVLACIPA